MAIKDLELQVLQISHIFRNEYIDRELGPFDQRVNHRVQLLAKFDEIAFDEATGAITIPKKKTERHFLLNYFSRMVHYAFDAYLIVLFALEDICEGNLVINESKLVKELHLATLQMYADNVIKELPSCLQELIQTALRRFDAINAAVIERYTTSNGATISFVSCPFERLNHIEELKVTINKLQQFNQYELQVIADRTQEAINNSLIQHMVAKL